MAYSELIKNFEKIREYMNDFYVYGFKTRKQYKIKSARSYDNERRRIESWLGNYMSFHRDSSGKIVFIALDSRDISENPLYNAFKAKSFTKNDIMLHFYILDILADGNKYSVSKITETIFEKYLCYFEDTSEPDESTIRKKLKEYEKAGILVSQKCGKELLFRRNESNIELNKWREAIEFFSETAPLGVVGSYINDKFSEKSEFFSFKHHYILYALESEILYSLICAMNEHRSVTVEIFSPYNNKIRRQTLLPLKIYISTQNGRRYVFGWHYNMKRNVLYRLDNIKKVTLNDTEYNIEKYKEYSECFSKKLWGVSSGHNNSCDHIEMIVFIGNDEGFILNRLEREKRCGKVKQIDQYHFKFTADIYDAVEMLPWLRTFIGRIVKLECSNKYVIETFYSDLKDMEKMYEEDKNVVQ